MRLLAPRVVVVLLALLAVAPVQAQRRDVRGRIADAAGVPVARLAVELRQDGTVVRTVVTDADGEFAFDILNLSDGPYEIRVAVPGSTAAVVRLTDDPRRNTLTVGGFTVDVQVMSLATAEPPPPPPPPPPPKDPASDPNNHAVVPVFYATDRDRVSYVPLVYGTAREPSKQLHLGRIDVSLVPRDHQMGQLERPTIWTFGERTPSNTSSS